MGATPNKEVQSTTNSMMHQPVSGKSQYAKAAKLTQNGDIS